MKAQEEEFFCRTDFIEDSIGEIPGGYGWFNTDEPYFFRIYIHFIRRSDGTGGQPENADQIVEILNEDFNEHNIYFIRECEINYINSDFHFNAEICTEYWLNPPIYDESPHDDGIDIYIFPSDEGRNCGRARAIPSTAFFVSGIPRKEPLIPLAESSALSHEMGHCLGLWHTHKTYSCLELVNQSNCISCGDYVCDTNADPYLDENVDYYQGCVWDNTGTDANGDVYDPDTGNIMSGTNISCMKHFTPGQVERMRQMIAFSPILQACLVDEPDFFGEIISTNTIWTVNNTPNNGNVVIDNNLIINCNATLTIEEGVTVKFKTENKLIITQGATLILEGTLTGENASSTWLGVEVWGESGESQYYINGIKAQGRFVGRSGSIVENAETAVKLYGPDITHAGGQISCNGTTFRNNITAVKFAPYENFWPFATPQQGQPRNYFGHFTSCEFENNDDYAHAEGFNAFLYLTGVNGIRITGCNFTNTQTSSGSTVADYGYGIFATDAGFTVQAKCTGSTYPCNNYERGSFSGLGYAIHTSTALNNRPFIIKQTDFSNCYIGIKSNAASGGTILFNDFNLGNVPDPSVNNGEQLGVFFETEISGFTLQQNDFTGEAGNVQTTVGVHCKNIGNFNNVIRKNNYTGLTFGNVAQGQNAAAPGGAFDRGLHYLCNINTNVSDADFGVVTDPNTNANRIRQSQGLGVEDDDGNITYDATGNQFSYGSGFDFINEGDAIDYYYYLQGANQVPLTTSGGITSIQSPENECPEDYCEPICKTWPEIIKEKKKYYQSKSSEAISKGEWLQAGNMGNTILAEQSKKASSYHRLQMDKSAYMVVQYLLYDTINFNADTLAVWLDNLDVMEKDMNKALKVQSEGKHTLADNYLAEAGQRGDLSPQQQADLPDMSVLLSVLDGKSPYLLEKPELQQLEALSAKDLSWTAGVSRNILGLYGYRFAPSYRLPGANEKNKRLLSGNTIKDQAEITAYPNPNTGTFTFVWQPKDTRLTKASLTIRNVSGKVIHIQEISSFDHQKVALEGMPTGVYFYQLRIEAAAPKEGKIIIQ